jgi:hypothetical protein
VAGLVLPKLKENGYRMSSIKTIARECIGDPNGLFYLVEHASDEDGSFVAVERRCGWNDDSDVMFDDKFTPEFAEKLGSALIAAAQKAKQRKRYRMV